MRRNSAASHRSWWHHKFQSFPYKTATFPQLWGKSHGFPWKKQHIPCKDPKKTAKPWKLQRNEAQIPSVCLDILKLELQIRIKHKYCWKKFPTSWSYNMTNADLTTPRWQSLKSSQSFKKNSHKTPFKVVLQQPLSHKTPKLFIWGSNITEKKKCFFFLVFSFSVF